MPKKDASKMEKHVFRIYDSNNDGYIDFIEFMLIFHIMSEGTPEEVLDKIFRVFDVNSDGSITKKEMARLIKDMYGLIKSEDPEAQSKDLIAKSAFAEMDQDGDGKITCAEFTAACLSQVCRTTILASIWLLFFLLGWLLFFLARLFAAAPFCLPHSPCFSCSLL